MGPTLLITVMILFLLSPILAPFVIDLIVRAKSYKVIELDATRRRDEEQRRHEEWQADIKAAAKPKSSIELPKIALNVKKRDNLNCPLCLDRVDTDVIMCVKCNTLLHYECVGELNKGSCPVLGCETFLGSEKPQPHRENEAEKIIRRVTRA